MEERKDILSGDFVKVAEGLEEKGQKDPIQKYIQMNELRMLRFNEVNHLLDSVIVQDKDENGRNTGTSE